MRLFAALVPPREVLDRVAQLAAGVHAEPEPQPIAEAAKLGPGRHAAPSGKRFGRRRDQGTAPTEPNASSEPTGPLLDLVPPVRMHVPIVKFGNLALDHAARLIDALELEASGWQTPRLHLHGGLALEPEGDTSVWVRLGGDLDELNAAVQGVFRVAKGHQLFVDRRAFRPDLQLGTINERTTEAHLEQLLAELEAYESQSWWQTTMSLLIPIDLGPDKAPYKLHREVSLGPAVPH
jgi:2'-5' RNA ligase